MPSLRCLRLLCLLAAPVHAQTPRALLGDLTCPEAEGRIRQAPLVVVPFEAGAKEHGPHLPVNRDAVVMEYLCRIAVDSLPVLVALPADEIETSIDLYLQPRLVRMDRAVAAEQDIPPGHTRLRAGIIRPGFQGPRLLHDGAHG